jgi:glycine cleavage system H protein
MNFPANLRYTKSHEWIKQLDGGLLEIGITDYAQKELGDIVYVELPQIGDEIKADTPFGNIESVKTVSEIISPLTGTVKEVNQALNDAPDSVNKSPYDAWLIRAEGELPGGDLLTAEEYQKHLP